MLNVSCTLISQSVVSSGVPIEPEAVGGGIALCLKNLISHRKGPIMVDKNRVEGAVENTIGKIEDTVGAVAEDAPTQAEGKARQAAATAQSAYGETFDSARELAQEVGGVTRQQPYWMLLAAAAIGFVVGRFSANNTGPRHPR
jgi:uncharacterized protein YjbJ (UPF0337 family)